MTLLGAGCIPPQTTYRPPPNCHPNFPNGIAHGLNMVDPWFELRFIVTASYEFKEPALAKERIPELFVDHLNRESGYEKYRLADGPNHNATVYLNLYQDGTHDHYGMSVRFVGPPYFTDGPGATVGNVNWFLFYLDPSYRTGYKLFEDAAIKASQFLNNGWSC